MTRATQIHAECGLSITHRPTHTLLLLLVCVCLPFVRSCHRKLALLPSFRIWRSFVSHFLSSAAFIPIHRIHLSFLVHLLFYFYGFMVALLFVVFFFFFALSLSSFSSNTIKTHNGHVNKCVRATYLSGYFGRLRRRRKKNYKTHTTPHTHTHAI